MIGDVLARCATCGERPKRHDIIEQGGNVWWTLLCSCGPRLLHMEADSSSVGEPTDAEIALDARDRANRAQARLLRLEERVERLEDRLGGVA
jgi:hypothetical protein